MPVNVNFAYVENNEGLPHFRGKKVRHLSSGDLFSTLLANLALRNKPLGPYYKV